MVPEPPSERYSSVIKVGVFDGGMNIDPPFVENFVTEHNPVQTEKAMNFIQHGLGVAGAILFSALSCKLEKSKKAPKP